MNARIVKMVVAIVIALSVLVWLRDGRRDFDIRSTLPFMRGRKPALYEWGALAMAGIGAWGLWRSMRQTSDDA